MLRSMSLSVTGMIFATLMPLSGQAEPIGSVYKVVKSGQTASMGFHYEVSHDCRALGAVAMNLIEPPQNGEVFVHPKQGRTSFAATSAYSTCNNRSVAGVEVYYRSAPGFVGPDFYVIERVFPNGNAQKFKISVSVR